MLRSSFAFHVVTSCSWPQPQERAGGEAWVQPLEMPGWAQRGPDTCTPYLFLEYRGKPEWLPACLFSVLFSCRQR